MIKRIFTALFSLLPFKLDILFLKMIGHTIDWRSQLGFNLYLTDYLELERGAKIGHFNLFKVSHLQLKQGAQIGHLNIFKGPVEILLNEKSAIGKLNKVTRAYKPITYGKSSLELGEGTRITYDNFFDLTLSIRFGSYSQVAGKDSQFWTHGYYHAQKGKDRIRVDGPITIGDNVYIGSRSLFNPGVTVGNSINIGGNSVISKDILEPGMYVNQPLRYIETSLEQVKGRLTRIDSDEVKEIIYTKEK